MKRFAVMVSASVMSIVMSSMPVFADVVEIDDNNAAYVLDADGNKNYNDVESLVNDPENAEATGSIISSVNYDLGQNGPTLDQNLAGIPKEVSAEYYAGLMDNVVNWDEIPYLVEYWNPTYVKVYGQANMTISEMASSYEEFCSQMKTQIDSVDEQIENVKELQKLFGNSAILQATLEAFVKGKSTAVKAMTTTKRVIYSSGNTVKRALNPVKYQLTSVVETLVISYKTLEVNRALVQEQINLYEELVKTQSNLQEQSIVTSSAVLQYKNQLNAARKSLADIDSGLVQLRKNIAIQCGYSADTDIVIADLPAPDYNYMNGRNYEYDKSIAVNGNSAVVSAGKLRNYEFSSYGMQLRDLGQNEAISAASAKMDSIHTELERQLILSGSTAATLQKAALAEKSANAKYEMGMLGRAEYEAQKMSVLSYRANAKLNDLNLHQAIQNYKWAMLGVMSAE